MSSMCSGELHPSLSVAPSVSKQQPRIQDLAMPMGGGGGAVLLERRHMGGYGTLQQGEFRPAIRKAGVGCCPCQAPRVRHSAWGGGAGGGGGGGGRQLVPEGGIIYQWGGGGWPPPPPQAYAGSGAAKQGCLARRFRVYAIASIFGSNWPVHHYMYVRVDS